MTFKNPIPIEIEIYTEEECKLLELGLELQKGESSTELRYFYNIESVYKNRDADRTDETSCFYSGGLSFITAMPLDRLMYLIEKHSNTKKEVKQIHPASELIELNKQLIKILEEVGSIIKPLNNGSK